MSGCACGAPRSAFVTDTAQGVLVCGQCGIIQESNLVTDEAFSGIVNSGGGPGRGGRGYMQRFFGGSGNTSTVIDRMRNKMREVADLMHLPAEMVEEGMRVYQMILQKRVVIHKRIQLVCCACLYYVSRIRADFNSHLMLVDFSEAVMESPFTIGSVYDVISKTLRLKADTVDPALFLKKYVNSLGIRGDDVETVTHSANVIISRMNRDWITQGRRPAGVIAAAVYLACRMHGFTRVRIEHVTRVLNISSGTVVKRLVEVSKTLQNVLNIETVAQENETAADLHAVPEALRASRIRQKEAHELLRKQHQKSGKGGPLTMPSYISNTEIKRLERDFGARHDRLVKANRGRLCAVWRQERKRMRADMQEKAKKFQQGKNFLKEVKRAEKRAQQKKTAQDDADAGADADVDADAGEGDSDGIAAMLSSDGLDSCSDASGVSSETYVVRNERRFRFRAHLLADKEKIEGDPDSDEYSDADSLASTASGASIDIPLDKKETLDKLEFDKDENADQPEPQFPAPQDDAIPLPFDDPLGILFADESNLVVEAHDSDDRKFDVPFSQTTMDKISSVIGNAQLGNEPQDLTMLEQDAMVGLPHDLHHNIPSLEDQLIDLDIDMAGLSDVEDMAVKEELPGMLATEQDHGDLHAHGALDELEDVPDDRFEATDVVCNDEDLSDVSDTYYDDWVVDNYEEIMQRRKLWMDCHGDYLVKIRQRRKRDRQQDTKEKKRRKRGESHLMPTTIAGVWASTNDAVKDSLAGSSNINMENVDRLFYKVDDMVNTHRKRGMGTILGEVGEDFAFEEDDDFA